ncbi:hypothetical protein [Melittangium boletus]|uniref:hypothetical protein n=1 Tax=Melittangium boletus TaxID=83453 RepID=UPI003DA5943B
MEDEKREEGTQHGPFLLQECVETTPGVGSVYLAQHVDTGAPALVLLGAKGVRWESEGVRDLEVIRDGPNGALVTRVHKIPATLSREELDLVLQRMTEMLLKWDDVPSLRVYFEDARSRQLSWRWYVQHGWKSPWIRVLVFLSMLGLAFAINAGVKDWWATSHKEPAPAPLQYDEEAPGTDAEAPLYLE